MKALPRKPITSEVSLFGNGKQNHIPPEVYNWVCHTSLNDKCQEPFESPDRSQQFSIKKITINQTTLRYAVIIILKSLLSAFYRSTEY